MMNIPLSRPDITDKEVQSIVEVLKTPNLSMGPKLQEFEEKFAAQMGSQYALAVNSGTSGLHLCIRALDIKDEDKVITTPFSFVSSANCILFERGRPIFVDIDESTLNVDLNKLGDTIKKLKDNNRKIKAIIPVHVFGRPCEMDEIMELAQNYGLEVIEDACEAVNAEYYSETNGKLDWKKVGTFGTCGVFGFYPNKQITTGEGGMIVTDSERIDRLCRSMRNQGRSENSSWLEHERLGYNYRISDLNCALGITQLQRIDEILAKRKKVARLYNEKLSEIDEIILPCFEENKKISWFVYVIRLANKFSQKDRNLIRAKLK